jgi:hypothetical protein
MKKARKKKVLIITADLKAKFDDLLARMQTPAARKAMDKAFYASPAEVGKAAVAAARKRP